MSHRLLGSSLVALVLALPLASVAAPGTPFEIYKLDPVHSTVIFGATHLGVSKVYGRFDDVSGTVSLNDKVELSSMEIDVKTESIDTNNAKRDGHLKSQDFFNAKQFPDITFKSTAMKKTGDKTFEVTGDLSLHGVTKSITIPFTRIGSGKSPMGDFRSGGEARFTVKRSDFGMSFMADAIGDEIDLIVSVEGVKQ